MAGVNTHHYQVPIKQELEDSSLKHTNNYM